MSTGFLLKKTPNTKKGFTIAVKTKENHEATIYEAFYSSLMVSVATTMMITSHSPFMSNTNS